MIGNGDTYSLCRSKLERLPDNVIVIGSQTNGDNRKEKVSSAQDCFDSSRFKMKALRGGVFVFTYICILWPFLWV